MAGVVVRHRDGRTEEISARVVIGADGRGSRVARAVHAPITHRGTTASAVAYAYWAGLDLERFDWAFTAGSGAGAITTDDDLTCVFAATRASRFSDVLGRDMSGGFHEVLRSTSPTLADAVEAAERRGPVRGFPGMPSLLRRPYGPGWALVGDAGYWKDPATGHGISDALRDAEFLAAALDRGSRGQDLTTALRDYELRRDQLSRPLLAITDRIASYRWAAPEAQHLHLRMSEVVDDEIKALHELDRRAPALAA